MTELDVKGLPCAVEAIAHAIRDFPREAVGVVVVERGKPVYIACENTATKPGDEFRMGKTDWARAEARGEIIALIHSHPNAGAAPSDADRAQCEASGVPWWIIAVHDDAGTVSAVDVSRTEPCGYEVPLVGRQFHHGVLDCFTLIKDYYDRELGIQIPDFQREDNWWNMGQNLYMDNFEKAGFEIAAGNPQLHDVILMQIRSPVPNHAGIYLGNTMVLHHMWGRLSSRDVFGGYLREATRLILRHRSLK